MAEKKYTKEHEWVEVDGDTATVGITNHAQESLGDIVFIDLPTVGKAVKSNEELCVIESVKAASDLVAPVSGMIIEVNSRLEDEPELVTEDSMGEGWFIKVKLSNTSELDDLMDESAYNSFIEE